MNAALLLDTHAFLWFFTDPPLLPTKVRRAIEDESRRVLVSSVSVYELAFKRELGKLDEADVLLTDLTGLLGTRSFETLEVTHAHALAAGRLDTRPRDPFDRILTAQALVEQVELVSNEKLFDSFGVRRLW